MAGQGQLEEQVVRGPDLDRLVLGGGGYHLVVWGHTHYVYVLLMSHDSHLSRVDFERHPLLLFIELSDVPYLDGVVLRSTHEKVVAFGSEADTGYVLVVASEHSQTGEN